MTIYFKDMFRIRLGADPPVDFLPMEIKFDKEERPVKVRQRTYSPKQLDVMKKKCDELLEVGYIYVLLPSCPRKDPRNFALPSISVR